MNGPTRTKSRHQCAAINFQIVGPLGQRLGLAIPFKHGVCASIVGLDFWKCPPAIFRRVSAIYIDTIKRMLVGWPWSHVCQEVLERVNPSIADCNTSASVDLVSRRTSVIAATFHMTPRNVLASFSESVRAIQMADLFNSKASARSRIAFSKISRSGVCLTATIAETEPFQTMAMSRNIRSWGAHGEQPETHTLHVNSASAHMQDFMRSLVKALFITFEPSVIAVAA